MRWLVVTALVGLLAGCAAPAVEPDEVTPAAMSVPAGSVKVVAVGDIACAPGVAVTPVTCQQAATALLTQDIDPRWVFALGDEQYESGRLADYQASYDMTWGTLKGRTLPVPGNHEYRTAGAKGYYAYFNRSAPGYYARNVGSWRVYFLNSNCDRINCTAEQSWLRKDLEANPHRCAAITMHHARYSSGEEHGSSTIAASLWRTAYRHHVDLALAGHDHDYERFARMDAGGHQVSNGLVSFVSGTGGKSLYAQGTPAKGSKFFYNQAFGVLTLWLGDTGFAWQFRTTDGTVRDAGNRSCS